MALPESNNNCPVEASPIGPSSLGETGAARPWRPELQNAASAGLPGFGAAAGMDESPADLPMGPSRLKASLSRANLVLFALFMTGVGVVAFMSLKKGPEATKASDKQDKQQQQVHSAIERFLNAETSRAKGEPAQTGQAGKPKPGTEELLRDTRGLVQMFFNFTSKNQVSLDDLKTNPFRFAGEGKPAKAEPKPADAAKVEEARKKRIEQVKSEFDRLKLQTVINGPSGRQAMINSTVVKAGDSIGLFKVIEITARQVVLNCDEQTFKLEITY